MKKLIALLAVCGFAFAFVACGKKTEEAAAPAEDTTAVVAPVAADSADTTTVATDTTAH